MSSEILRQALKQASEEMGFYVEEIHDSGVPEMSLKLKYKTMTFEKDRGVWYAKSERCIGAAICILQQVDFEWVSDDGIYLTAQEHHDLGDFMDQLNAGGPK